ncbi:LasA protease [Pseudoalteromonas undina]|uniref:LasA protease n=1 Tax=Pseudoalteromonas undina TaxID=43660 RepID=A0ABN0NMI1_9GAMM|nr:MULTISPECIES: M23 family metallopeptidase [Pseudoalteromonas]KAF7766093.1 LasA protease [Pseudoalteromonas undina]KPZ64195.1 Protease LasA precursor [Pseudoalteromonas sp. P1-16-1b]OLF79883.1 peptidase M23 [Pseudoalteromonas haloplanktis]
MKNKIINITFASLLGASPVVLAEGDKHDDFLFTKQALASLKLNSLLTIDDTQFVFNDSLLNEDWDNFFSLHASAIEDKKELILHWAGYTSINPKVILALIEQQSGLLSNPNADIENPLAGITDKRGFDAQVKDVVMKLSQRFYAYKQWQESQDKLKKRNQATQTTSSTAATAALVSLFADSDRLASNSKNNQQTLTEFLATFDRVFPSNTSQLQRSLNSVDQNNEKQLLAASFEMNLPWPSGYWYSGGAHSNTGSGYPYSSLDFNNGSGGWGANTPFVQAAHGGTVTRFSSCNIRVTHASGYSTNYYHMSNLQYSSGDYVQPGAWLGRYANNYNQALCEGGQSSGPHVHFTLLYNGQQVSLHNKYISEHRIDVGSSNYDTNCNRFYFERYGYRTCAWQPLYR